MLRLILGLSILLPIAAQAQAPACRYEKSAIEIADATPLKKLALTFDDGPNPETTPHVLDVLRKYHIHATFFLIGENIPGNSAIVRRILREGHLIGNHTYTHPHLNELKQPEIVREMLKTENLLRKFPLKGSRLMRFPYGDSSCVAEATAENLHYNIVGWDIDSCDWSFEDGLPDGSCIEEEALRTKFRNDYHGWIDYQLAESPGGIILMHDAQPFTSAHVEGLIRHLKREGYSFVTLDSGLFPETLHDHAPWR